MAEEPSEARSPLVYLSDILVEIEFLKQATRGLTFEQYVKSGERRRAVERSLEIISEASRGVPEIDQSQHPDIPWRRIRDLGNVLRHAYFGIMHELIWAIVSDDLAQLERTIRAISSRYEHPPR